MTKGPMGRTAEFSRRLWALGTSEGMLVWVLHQFFNRCQHRVKYATILLGEMTPFEKMRELGKVERSLRLWCKSDPKSKVRNRRLNGSVQPAIQSKAGLGKAIDKASSQTWLSGETHFLPKWTCLTVCTFCVQSLAGNSLWDVWTWAMDFRI